MFCRTSTGNLTKKQQKTSTVTVSPPKKLYNLASQNLSIEPYVPFIHQMVQIHKMDESWTCRYFGEWGNSWYPWALHSYNFSIGEDSSILGTNEMVFVSLMFGLPRCPPENKRPTAATAANPRLGKHIMTEEVLQLESFWSLSKKVGLTVEYQTSGISKLLSHPVQLLWCIILPESLWGKQTKIFCPWSWEKRNPWLAGWWLNQPNWKTCGSQIGSFPQKIGGWKAKIFELPPPSFSEFVHIIQQKGGFNHIKSPIKSKPPPTTVVAGKNPNQIKRGFRRVNPTGGAKIIPKRPRSKPCGCMATTDERC